MSAISAVLTVLNVIPTDATTWVALTIAVVFLRSFGLLCHRAYTLRTELSTWVNYDPRRASSPVRKVTFKGLQTAKNELSGNRRFEFEWFAYSLAMPAYEKTVASLDSFDDKFVLKQEFEHSRVHAKLNDTYEDSFPVGGVMRPLVKAFKAFWRSFFGLILKSPVKDLMILGEVTLGFNMMDPEGHLEHFKYASMSKEMKKTIVYHDLEEIEHGLDLVPRVAAGSCLWRCVLAAAFSLEWSVFNFVLECQTLTMHAVHNPRRALRRSVWPVFKYFVDPLQMVDPKIWYAVLLNRFPSREFRDEKEAEYIRLAKEMHGMDLSSTQVII